MDSQINLLNIISDVQPVFSTAIEVITSPNPFNEKVTLQFSLLSDSKVELFVQDVLGRTIINHSRQCNTGINNITLEAGEFNDGAKLYLYKLLVNGKLASSGKLIKN